MSRSEVFNPFGDFEARPVQTELDPHVVSSQTANVLENYFDTDGLLDPSFVRRYLSNDALDFMYRAERGFFLRFFKIDKHHKIDPNDLPRFFNRSILQLNDPVELDAETFDFFLVALSAVPEFGKHDLLPQGFSRRGTFQPPSTTRDFFETVDEFRSELTGIANGSTKPAAHIESRSSLFRTFVTFQVARDLPLHMPQLQKEIEQQSRETFEGIIGDLQINL